jgi:hypothetical protein
VLKFTIDGKPVRGSDLSKEMMRRAAAKVAHELRERLGSIRHPDTGEFPFIIIEGDSLEDMRFRVEGSPGLLEIVKARLSPEDQQAMAFVSTEADPPRAFLSYAGEDRDLAKKIAEGLQAHGIKTWWAEWEIRAGDSIRRKIDEGLGDCTHFLVLLTPQSINKPWVNEEIDAGFVRKVNAKSRFIPLRHALGPEALPPLLSGMLSPRISADASNLLELVNDIHGLTQKPPLGVAPTALDAPRTGYSAAATTVASVFVARSEHGGYADPRVNIDDLVEEIGLTSEDVADALHELRHRLKVSYGLVTPEASLYSEFDHFWKPWNPADDALRIAADFVNKPKTSVDLTEIAARYDWPPRRLNPAITYLAERGVIHLTKTLGRSHYVGVVFPNTDAARRFVKSRS